MESVSRTRSTLSLQHSAFGQNYAKRLPLHPTPSAAVFSRRRERPSEKPVKFPAPVLRPNATKLMAELYRPVATLRLCSVCANIRWSKQSLENRTSGSYVESQ